MVGGSHAHDGDTDTEGKEGPHPPPTISCRSCGPAILPRGLIHVYVDSCSRSNVRPATPIQPHPIRNDNTFPFNPQQLFLSLVPPTDKHQIAWTPLRDRSCIRLYSILSRQKRANGSPTTFLYPIFDRVTVSIRSTGPHLAIPFRAILFFISEATGPTVYLPPLCNCEQPAFQRSLGRFGTTLTPRGSHRSKALF